MTNTAQANQPDNDTLDMHSPNLVDDNVQKIMALFPNCITESEDEHGKLKKAVDFDLLRQELSQSLVEGGQERYRLDWPGKRQAILEANSPIAKTLRPAREESVNFDTTENLFIEGDNLDALKLLQESYLGQIKMIYIDPPYNTGNDFIYKDDFSENTADFLERSEQVDEEGNRLIDNPESNGCFHSDWLTMMYSRLKLARNILKDDGAIFISIDENEVNNLVKISDEIFGSDNRIGIITVNGNPRGRDYGGIAKMHDYLLVYKKSSATQINNIPEVNKKFPFEDELGGFELRELRNRNIAFNSENRPNLYYPFYINPLNQDDNELFEISLEEKSGWVELYPKESQGYKTVWRWGKPKSRENLNIEIKAKGMLDGGYQIVEKYRNATRMARSIWLEKGVNTEKGSLLVKSLFDGKKYFPFPKPVDLVKNCLHMSTSSSNDIILDLFAGSATTAHAVMDMNTLDNGNRKFIMVQLPEKTEEKSEAFKAGFTNIAEISKERIRRAGQKILTDNQDKDGIENLDIGFRVLKIDSTNMKEVYYTPDEYSQAELDNLESHIKEDRTGEDLLFQVMLDWGVPLSLPIEVKQIQGSSVYYVGIDSLVACFDTLTTDLIDEISKDKPLKFVSSELAIAHDQDKTNIKARFAQLSPDTQVKFI